MIEKLFNSRGLDETRIKRAFNWVVTFRDFPEGSWQTVDSEGMIKDAVTLFTKGRAEFYLDDIRRADRLPGVLSTEHEAFPPDSTFKLVYTEPTTRVCIPRKINVDNLPSVEKILIGANATFNTKPNGRYLVCLGNISVGGKTFAEEKTFSTKESKECMALQDVILLEFLNEATR